MNELSDFINARYREAVPAGAKSVLDALKLKVSRAAMDHLIDLKQIKVWPEVLPVRGGG